MPAHLTGGLIRFPFLSAAMVIALLSCSAFAQSPPGLKIDRRSALIEVVASEATQQSPAAVQLLNRQLYKHMMLLQHPALLQQTIVNGKEVKDSAFVKAGPRPSERLAEIVRVRIVPDTNVIELSVDPAAGGEEAVPLATAIVNQHLENQREIVQNASLQRSVMLNNLKQRYQFRKDELGRDLREKAVQLSIDGIGMPGRLSAKEVELQHLLNLRYDLERKKIEAIGDTTAIDTQMKTLNERIDAAKAELGALTNAMNQYLTLKDDEQSTRDLLKKVNHELEQISQMGKYDRSEVRWLCHPSK